MDDRNGADGDRMRALAKAEPGEGMSLTERPVPEPGPGELRLRVESVGIDGGAEALIYGWHEAKRWYEPHLPQPFGHEFAGVVDAVGDGVDPDRAGDRVAVEPVIGCGDCRCCRAGDARLRPDRRIVGLDPGLPGAFAEYAIVPAANAYRVGDGVDPDGACSSNSSGWASTRSRSRRSPPATTSRSPARAPSGSGRSWPRSRPGRG
jgi:L-iditol 2-dehydrogenase/threonine 3-dehydrogenase